MRSLLAVVNLRANYYAGHLGANNLGSSPGSLLSNLLPNVLVVAGVVFLVVIVYSGINILVNAGGGNAQMIGKHKGAFWQALLGFLIVVGAFFILQIISTVTGVDLANPNI